jgi:hypothetical protein
MLPGILWLHAHDAVHVLLVMLAMCLCTSIVSHIRNLERRRRAVLYTCDQSVFIA